jgi:uracil-DNA glycosylase family 4
MKPLSLVGIDKVNKHLFTEMSSCHLCPNVNHSQIYAGVYRPGQKYFFVGAAPWNLAGEQEAFRIGKASENFEKYLKAAGIDREECFTTNAVVHIPVNSQGESRQPTHEESFNCSRYLSDYIRILNPPLVIALGRVALETLSHVYPHHIRSIYEVVRKPMKWKGRWLMACTHPSPMAVSFRGDDEQILDYKAIKEFYDRLP